MVFNHPLERGKKTSQPLDFIGSPGRTRTCNLVVNSHPLLPVELPGNLTSLKFPSTTGCLSPLPAAGKRQVEATGKSIYSIQKYLS
jgi:hypothetical protein